MTSFDVDLDELRAAVQELASCQRGLIALATDIDAAQTRLGADWRGLAAAAERRAHDAWRTGCADMVTALAALRAVAAAADEHYSRAAEANVARWLAVSG
jgi:uncharacterized protein YukE